MKLTKLHLIIILGLVIILCPIFGVCSNAREGFNPEENQEEEQTEEGMQLTGGKDKKVKQEYMSSDGYSDPNFADEESKDGFENDNGNGALNESLTFDEFRNL